MLHSIRWRLILSYTALTLLTILLIGVVALSFASRYMDVREHESLWINAQAVARMARPHLVRPDQKARLQQLALSAGFLTNTELKILSVDRRVLAFSQQGPSHYDTVPNMMTLLSEVSPAGVASSDGGAIRQIFVFHGPGQPRGILWGDIDQDNTVTRHSAILSLERRPGYWGSRLIFVSPEDSTSSETDSASQESWQHDNAGFRRLWRTFSGSSPASAEEASEGPQVTLPVYHEQQIVGYIQMTNRHPLSTEPLLAIRFALLIAGLGAVLVAVILGFVMSRTLTAPLMALESATQQMEKGDLTVRAPETVGEVGNVSRRFNSMAARLQLSFAELAAERDALRRFIADASHELRTPLTALRQFVEILQGQAGSEPDTRSEFLGESQRQLERLQWITGHLLDLSRLEGGVAALDIARHDLTGLLEEAMAPFRSTAAAKQIELRLSLSEELDTIWCDRASLGMALANLLDNALKFTPSGGVVELAATVDENTTVLSVSDNGPGIQPAEQELIFERFYRGETSEPLPGAGLGLAIAKSAVEAHGGAVSVENRDGAIFAIEIPSGPPVQQQDQSASAPLA